MRPMRGKRLGVFALLGLVAFSAAAVGQVLPPDGQFLPTKDMTCWPCHKDDTPVPLRAFSSIVPPESLEVPVGGDPVVYTVQVSNAWLEDIRFLAPAVNLTSAPSLRFGGGLEPILDQELPGTIMVDPTDLAGEHTDRQEIPVLGGASSLEITLRPDSTGPTAPRLEMRIYTPVSGDTPWQAYPAGANGEPPTTGPLGEEVFQEQGYGNWTVEAVYVAVRQDGPVVSPPSTQIPYTVTYTELFETGGRRIFEQPLEVDLPKQGSRLFNWNLEALAAPNEGEYVVIHLNTTVHYDHQKDTGDDWGWAQQDIVVDVVANESSGNPMLVPRSDGQVVVRPPGNIPVSIDRISEAVGYFAAFLLISSIWSGGMFGKASRRQLNTLFGAAKRRVAFHNVLSYGLIAAAIAHTVIFIVEKQYYYTLGLIWGGLAILAMFGLGFTGALQVPMIRKWNYGLWRWTHYGMAVAAILFTVVHILLDGNNFGAFQETVGWNDPLDPRGLVD